MKQVLIAMICLMSSTLFAQKSLQHENKRGIQSTAYGALSTQFTKFNGQNALFTGAYGGWMINHKLMVGAGAWWMASKNKGVGLNAETHERNNLKTGYGGLMVEYYLINDRKFNVSASALVGGGILKNGKGKGTLPENGGDELKDIDATGYAVVQPSVNVEMSVTDWCRVGVGAGYRYIRGADMDGITNSKLSAPTANLTVKFGIF
ncbi:MAG: hypothetical protein H7Y27_11260 [Gemmatimonadaceae bacterium]|nr:hypothetical protein [Chitinophagaceae bacterium]